MEADRTTGEDLRQVGATMDGIGLPWLFTLVALSGVQLPNGTWIVPLLWFAAPLVIRRMWRAADGLTGPPRRLLLGGTVVGGGCWAVGVIASIVGATEVMRSAFWVGTVVGTVLCCSGMLAVVRSLGWDDHTRLWRRTLRTFALGVALGIVAAGLLLTSELLPDGRGVGTAFWAAPVAIGATGVLILGWLRLSKILSATRAGLLTIPRTPLQRDELFGTGPT